MPQTMLEFVITNLKATEGDWPRVAAESGVHYRNVKNIGSQVVGNPGVQHVEKLANYFRENPPPRRANKSNAA